MKNCVICEGRFMGSDIEDGTFHGGELEGGTFHYGYPIDPVYPVVDLDNSAPAEDQQHDSDDLVDDRQS